MEAAAGIPAYSAAFLMPALHFDILIYTLVLYSCIVVTSIMQIFRELTIVLREIKA